LSATQPAKSIGQMVPNLPRSVIATIDRALLFDREQRWPDARAMQQAVRGSLEALNLAEGRTSSRLSMPGPLGGVDTIPPSSAPTVAAGPPVQQTQLLDWGAERDTQTHELEKLRPQVASLQQRALVARKRVEEAKAKLDGVRAERRSLEEWFSRQVGTRTAAVEEARKMVRAQLSTLAQRAIAHRPVFGDEFNADRDEIAQLSRASEARAKDVHVHEAALKAYDARRFRQGIILGAVLGVFIFLLFTTPIVLRATLPAPPPELPPPASS